MKFYQQDVKMYTEMELWRTFSNSGGSDFNVAEIH